MRRMMLFPAAFIFVLLASFTSTVSAQPRTDIGISYQTFYDELDPYGRWMDYPDYGYVWIPEAGPDFQPYQTNGHWVWTDEYGWMWVSDYNWGWAPFHYGRWLLDSYYGWIWVPGYEWSPAWVAWRDGGDYYGWAPLRPGINISINFSLGGYNPPIDYWCFAPRRYITSHRIYDYCAPRRNNVTIINHTTIINNYTYNRNVFRTGPGRRDAERYAGRIHPVRFRESNSPGRTRFRNNEVAVYRPQVQRNNDRNIAPHKFERFDRNKSNERNISRNGNNLPQPRQRDANRGDLGRRNSEIAERRSRVFDRGNNNNNNDRIINRERRESTPHNGETRPSVPPQRRNGNISNERPSQRQDVPERRNIERPSNNNRRVERRDINRNNNDNNRQMRTRPQSQPQRQYSPQPQQRRQEPSRQFERRNENGGSNHGGGNHSSSRGFGRHR